MKCEFSGWEEKMKIVTVLVGFSSSKARRRKQVTKRVYFSVGIFREKALFLEWLVILRQFNALSTFYALCTFTIST